MWRMSAAKAALTMAVPSTSISRGSRPAFSHAEIARCTSSLGTAVTSSSAPASFSCMTW